MLLCLIAPRPPAAADEYTPTALGLTGFYAMEVDDERRQVFVSGGKDATRVAIADFDGNVKGHLAGIPGPTGLAVVGSTLFVAAHDSSEIKRFDLSTSPPTPLPSFSTAPNLYPRDLIYLGGKLWFSTNCSGDGTITGLSLDGTERVEVPSPYPTSWEHCPALDGSSSAPNLLFVWARGISPKTLTTYDLTTSPPTRLKNQWGFDDGELGDMEPLPGGERFVVGGCDGVTTYDLNTGPMITYPSTTCLTPGVDVAEGEGTLLAAISGDFWDRGLWLYRLGHPTPFRLIGLQSRTGRHFYDGGLAVSSDASRVFVLVETRWAPRLYAIDPLRYPTELSLETSRDRMPFGNGVDVTVRLEPFVPGEKVTVHSEGEGGDGKTFTGPVDREGRFRFRDHPQENASYSAVYDGGETLHASASKTVRVNVRAAASTRLRGYYSYSGRYKLYREGQEVVARGVVAPDHAGHTVRFDLHRREDDGWVKQAQPRIAVLDEDSAATTSYQSLSQGSYRTRIRIAEHDDHLRAVSRWAFFKVTTAKGSR